MQYDSIIPFSLSFTVKTPMRCFDHSMYVIPVVIIKVYSWYSVIKEMSINNYFSSGRISKVSRFAWFIHFCYCYCFIHFRNTMLFFSFTAFFTHRQKPIDCALWYYVFGTTKRKLTMQIEWFFSKDISALSCPCSWRFFLKICRIFGGSVDFIFSAQCLDNDIFIALHHLLPFLLNEP